MNIVTVIISGTNIRTDLQAIEERESELTAANKEISESLHQLRLQWEEVQKELLGVQSAKDAAESRLYEVQRALSEKQSECDRLEAELSAAQSALQLVRSAFNKCILLKWLGLT